MLLKIASMEINSHNCLKAFLLIFFFVGFTYSNTYDASWHFDDFGNIVENPKLHIFDLYPESLSKTIRASINDGYYNNQSLYRPVAMFSFALNWYFGKADVIGYHIVNTLVHITAAFFLYLSIFNLLKTPNIGNRYRGNRHPIALMAAIMWAVHPIQIQGVTYIVQRMASMAAMFYIMAIFFYLKGKLSEQWPFFYYSLCLLTGLLALGSKENATILPLSILWVEIIFFQKIKRLNIQKYGLISVVVIFFLGLVFVFYTTHLSFLDGYSYRPFTLSQRLMTEARVIVLYFYKLIYPVASNYSIGHDIEISTSLFSPWTTIPSIIVIFALVGASIKTIKQYPLIGFSLLFFFLNHLVESTIIPLELIFEHRNYLPTMFLFLPLAAGLQFVLDFYRNKNKGLLLFIFAAASSLLFLTGLATYTRNFDWKSEETLWTSAIRSAPGNPRFYQNLASLYYQSTGAYDKAIALHEQALLLKDKRPEYSKMVSFDNLQFNYLRKKEFDKAVFYGKKALEVYPDSNNARYNCIVSLLSVNKLEEADHQVDVLITERKRPDLTFLYMKAHILLKLKNLDSSKAYILRAFKSSPLASKSQMYLGFYHFGVKHYDQTDYYLNLAIPGMMRSDQPLLYLVLIENAIHAGWPQKLEHYCNQFLSNFTVTEIIDVIEKMEREKYPLVKLSYKILRGQLSEAISAQAASLPNQGYPLDCF